MGLAHAHSAVNIERVITARGIHCDRLCGRVRKLIGGTDHKRVEGEFRGQVEGRFDFVVSVFREGAWHSWHAARRFGSEFHPLNPEPESQRKPADLFSIFLDQECRRLTVRGSDKHGLALDSGEPGPGDPVMVAFHTQPGLVVFFVYVPRTTMIRNYY